MEVLICRLWESVWLGHLNLAGGFTQFLKHESIVHCVHHAPLCLGVGTKQVLRNSLRVRKSTSLVVVVRALLAGVTGLALTHDLWSGTELKPFILRVIFNDSLVLVESTEILVLIRVGVLVEGVKPLVGSVDHF